VLALVKEERSMLSTITRRKKEKLDMTYSGRTKSVKGCDGEEDGGSTDMGKKKSWDDR